MQPSAAGTGRLAETLTQIDGVLDTLGRGAPGAAASNRPGSASWRSQELDKLRELVVVACRPGKVGCRKALDAVVAAQLPPDEARGLLGLFVGELRPLAEVGFGTLGRALLLGPDPVNRDLTFRLAVASGAARRGEPDELGRRVALIPPAPAVFSEALLVVEIPSPCAASKAEYKGPDVNGRIDLQVLPDCEGAEPRPPSPEGFPQPSRAVWALPVPIGAQGLAVVPYEAKEPLFSWEPPPAAKAPAPE